MRLILTTLLLIFLSISVFAAKQKPFTITSHVLDIQSGHPGGHIPVLFLIFQHGKWKVIKKGETNSHGQISFDIPKTSAAKHDLAQLRFMLKGYFKKSFFPYASFVVAIKPDQNYYVPLLIASNGFSIYHGSHN